MAGDVKGLAPLINLKELNLDHNNLTCFDYILALPSLAILRLNHNRIDGCSPATDTTGSSSSGSVGGGAAARERAKSPAVSSSSGAACALEVLLLGE